MKETKNTNKPTNVLNDILSGRLFSNIFLVKHRWYVLLLFGLALSYMAMHYYMEKTAKEIEPQEIKLTELREDYLRALLQQESLSKRSAVLKRVEERNIDLKEPKSPAKIIKVKK